MKKLEVEKGIEIAYEEAGSGDKYIISMQMGFEPICYQRELARQGYHVFMLWNRGTGESTKIKEDHGEKWFDLFAKDVITFADKMGIDKFIYTGASHGAGTGWHVVVNYPQRVKAFVAYVGGPHNISEAQFSFKMLSDEEKKKLKFQADTDDPAILRRRAKNLEWSIKRQETMSEEEKNLNYRRPLIKYGTEEKVVEILKTIQTPTLMIGGIDDPIARPDLELRAAMALPNCKLILYSKCGHADPQCAIIEETVQEVLFFLNNLEKTGRIYKEVIED